MEREQSEHIRKNFYNLIKYTDCNSSFLAKLFQDGVISTDDWDALNAIKSKLDQATKFYTIIRTRSGSFNILKQALFDTSQAGALDILKKCKLEDDSAFTYFGAIRYNKKILLGKGCNNTFVYKGKHGERDVAVKQISIPHTNKEVTKREVDFLKMLDWHEHIVRYFDAVDTDDYILIALELCDMNLDEWVKSKSITATRPQIEGVEVIYQATSGIAFLHENKVVHRDLKPANILIVRQATGHVRVKISDFGMAKSIPVDQSKYSVHSFGFGTEGWMAPEVMKANLQRSVDDDAPVKMGSACDIFSLGCVYYFVLTEGEHPFGNQYLRQANIFRGEVELIKDEIKSIIVKDMDIHYISLIREMIAHEECKRPTAFGVLATLAQLKNPEHVLEHLLDHQLSHINDNTGSELDREMEPEKEISPPYSPSQIGKRSKMSVEIGSQETSSTVPTENVALRYMQIDEAITAGDEEALKVFVKQGTDVNAPGYKLQTPLHLAAASSDKVFAIKAIMLLVNNNANTTAMDLDGYTYLHRILDDGTDLTVNQFHDIAAYLISKNLACLLNKAGSFLKAFSVPGGHTHNSISPFQMAVKNIEIEKETLSILQSHGVDFNFVDGDGYSVLFYALMGNRSLKMISTLVLVGSNLKHLTNTGSSLLHFSVAIGNEDYIRYFLTRGLDINGVDIDGNTPLHLAASRENYSNLAVIEFLLLNRANGKIKNNTGKSPLDLAMKWKYQNLDSAIDAMDEEAVKLLVLLGMDIEEPTLPLHSAASIYDRTSAVNIIKFLIDKGADPRTLDKNGCSFLHVLVDDGTTLTPDLFQDIVEFLLSNKLLHMVNAKRNLSSKSSCFNGKWKIPPLLTPLQMAVKNIEVTKETLSLLRTQGIDITMMDEIGSSVLFYAVVGKRSVQLLSELVEHGASPKYISSTTGWSFFSFVATHGSVEHIQFFLCQGLDPNREETEGYTPLHCVTDYSSENTLEKVRVLVENGADCNLENFWKCTPFNYISGRKDSESKKVAEFLRNHMSQ